MDFAKARSYQKGCEGRIFLTSDINTMESKIPPHIFYRKQGFQLIGYDSCCYTNIDIEKHEIRFDFGFFLHKKTRKI